MTEKTKGYSSFTEGSHGENFWVDGFEYWFDSSCRSSSNAVKLSEKFAVIKCDTVFSLDWTGTCYLCGRKYRGDRCGIKRCIALIRVDYKPERKYYDIKVDDIFLFNEKTEKIPSVYDVKTIGEVAYLATSEGIIKADYVSSLNNIYDPEIVTETAGPCNIILPFMKNGIQHIAFATDLLAGFVNIEGDSKDIKVLIKPSFSNVIAMEQFDENSIIMGCDNDREEHLLLMNTEGDGLIKYGIISGSDETGLKLSFSTDKNELKKDVSPGYIQFIKKVENEIFIAGYGRIMVVDMADRSAYYLADIGAFCIEPVNDNEILVGTTGRGIAGAVKNSEGRWETAETDTVKLIREIVAQSESQDKFLRITGIKVLKDKIAIVSEEGLFVEIFTDTVRPCSVKEEITEEKDLNEGGEESGYTQKNLKRRGLLKNMSGIFIKTDDFKTVDDCVSKGRKLLEEFRYGSSFLYLEKALAYFEKQGTGFSELNKLYNSIEEAASLSEEYGELEDILQRKKQLLFDSGLGNSIEFADYLTSEASFFYTTGQYGILDNKIAEATGRYMSILKLDEADKLMNLMGIWSKHKGSVNEAEMFHLHALDIRIDKFGKNGMESVTSLCNLMVLYLENGKREKAEKCRRYIGNIDKFPEYQRVLLLKMLEFYDHCHEKELRNLFTRCFEKGHTFRGLYHLSEAIIESEKGNFGKADSLSRKALKIFRNNLGDSHLLTIQAEYLSGAFSADIDMLTKASEKALKIFNGSSPLLYRITETLAELCENSGFIEHTVKSRRLSSEIKRDLESRNSLFPEPDELYEKVSGKL